MKKHAMRCILFAAAAALALCAPGFAYDYELDPVTGEPVVVAEESRFYEMPDGSQYEYETTRFNYTVSGVEFAANIPDGGVVSFGNTVSLWLGTGTSAEVYLDGTMLASQDLQSIRQAGSYVIKIVGKSGSAEATFRFTIIPDLIGTSSALDLPQGFLFDYVLLDTIPQEITYANQFSFDSDGEYEIRFSCAAINEWYILRFTRDTVAPELELNGITNGEAYGPVTIEFPEGASYIYIECEGETSVLRGGSKELRQPGVYKLSVYDEAGNSNSYEFIIQVYLDIGGGTAIGLILAALIAVIVYSRMVRKKARVG